MSEVLLYYKLLLSPKTSINHAVIRISYLLMHLPITIIGVYSEELYLAYSQEMSLRESIIGDLLSQSDRDTLTVYLSCWIHEPHITTSVNDHLEAMLFECSLRS